MTRTEELCSLLRQRIESGEFSPGDRFPSEYILAEEYAVNHKTANKAVCLLESQGYVKRGPRGAGTLVVRNQIFPRDLILFISRFSLFHARLLKGVQKAASNNGYAVVVLFASTRSRPTRRTARPRASSATSLLKRPAQASRIRSAATSQRWASPTAASSVKTSP